jgi:hypothetical protein
MSGAISAAIRSILDGHPHLSIFLITNRSLIEKMSNVSIWGIALPGVILMLAIGIKAFSLRKNFEVFGLAIVTAALWLSVSIFYWLVSFIGNIQYWLNSGVDRMYLPFTISLIVLSILVAGSRHRIDNDVEPST